MSISTLARVAVGALLVSATSALAADLPSRKVAPVAPVVAPAFTWTGFYVGADLGGAFGYAKGKASSGGVVERIPTLDASGLVGGIHAGYNYQMGMFVLGGEVDVWYNNINANKTYTVFGSSLVQKNDVGWQGTIRARGGVAIDRALLFVTAGVAIGSPETTVASGNTTITLSDTRAGFTVGGGAEYAFTNNWIGKVEYRYIDYGTKTVGTIAGINIKNSVQSNTVTAGVSYKF